MGHSSHTSDSSDKMPLPYSPSWLDRLNDLLERLPFPVWLFYVLLAVIFNVGFALTQWTAGQYPVGTFYPFHVYLTSGIFYGLAVVYYLDRYAHTAFARFRPALDATPEDEKVLRYQLTTLPARSTWFATLIGLGFGSLAFLVPLQVRTTTYNYAPTALSDTLYIAIYILVSVTWLVIVYHTIHQLRLLNLIFTRHTHVSLFSHRPLYAFSWLSAYTAIALIASAAGILLVPGIRNPGGIAQLFSSVFFVVVFLSLPFVTFVWPLLGIHRLLLMEKERLLDDNGAAMEHKMQEIRQRMGSNEPTEADSLNKVLETLETELRLLENEARLLKQTSTWPWQPGTLQSVIAAVLIPVGISLVQGFLQRFMP